MLRDFFCCLHLYLTVNELFIQFQVFFPQIIKMPEMNVSNLKSNDSSAMIVFELFFCNLYRTVTLY